MPKHQPNRAMRTRDALLAAGFDLMAQRSIEAIPIDDLVAKAGVGKGSFFNHFGDKSGFKAALAVQVRGDIETQIALANSKVDDPLERLAGGMREVTDYALVNRKRTIAMLRMTVGATAADNPMNEGVRADLEACVDAKLLRAEARTSGILFWLGACIATMTHVVERKLTRAEAADILRDMLLFGLTGLGATEARSRRVAVQSATLLVEARTNG